ncbi:hypothetical protein [Nonomuraea sp. NPDC046570]|uniref:hypothetical protein n=1 Tax=Nonomuraea sp. NPDC046570 TaxID=3155255 RepID=UPI0033E205A2
MAIIGVPGLEWSDLDQARTPNLWKLVGRGASASLSTRAVPPPDRGITCPIAGWLTVSAGQRAGTAGTGCALPPAPQTSGTGATVPGWSDLVTFQTTTGYGAQIGTLGQLVTDAGGKVAAIGPGAALAAANKSGNITTYADAPESVADLASYHLIVLEADQLATAWTSAPLSGDGFPIPLTTEARQTAVTQADQRIGALLNRLPADTTVLLGGVSDTSIAAHLHVAIADGPSTTGEPYRHGFLTATSTRQDALVTITDLTATAISLLGLDAPNGVVGRPWQSGGQAPPSTTDLVNELADEDLASQVLREVRGPFFAVFVAVQVLFYALAALALRRRRRSPTVSGTTSPTDEMNVPGTPALGDNTSAAGQTSPSDDGTKLKSDAATTDASRHPAPADDGTGLKKDTTIADATSAVGRRHGRGEAGSDAATSRVLMAVQAVAVLSGAIAVSTFLAQLVPWWSLPAPMFALIGTIVGFAGLITGLAFAGPWRAHVLGPLTVVAGVTSVALLIDVMTGSTLQVNAVTGYEPVTGGRFYGFSNIAFAVYATGTILALAGVAHWLLGRGTPRIVAVAACAVYGGFAVFADGWPAWGADFGGVPAFVIGLAVFLILLSGRKVSVVKLLLVGLAGAALIGAIAVFDWLRPAAQRTHLGTFVQQIIDGQAWTVIGRKFSSMIGITVGNWQLTLLSLVALAFLFLVLDRPSRWGASALGRAYTFAPPLRAGLFGALTCAFVGFLVNDSGIAIPAMALTVAVPLTLAACVRALQLSRPTTTEPQSAAATPTEPPAS